MTPGSCPVVVDEQLGYACCDVTPEHPSAAPAE